MLLLRFLFSVLFLFQLLHSSESQYQTVHNPFTLGLNSISGEFNAFSPDDSSEDSVVFPLDLSDYPEFTFEGWFGNILTISRDTAGFIYGTEDNHFSFGFEDQYLGPRVNVTIGGVSQEYRFFQGAAPSWVHIAFTYTATGGGSGTLLVVVDHVEATEAEEELIGSFPLPSAQAILGYNNFPFRAIEIRLWNTSKTTQEIRDDKFISFYGDEPGLRHYWRCDDRGQILHDASSSLDLTIDGVPEWYQHPVPVYGPGFFTPTKETYREIEHNEYAYLPSTCLDPINQAFDFSLDVPPVRGRLCFGGTTPDICEGDDIQIDRNVDVVFVATRDSCGTTDSFEITVSTGTQEDYLPLEYFVRTKGFTPVITPFVNRTVDTAGGQLVISGGLLGVDGPLGVNEFVQYTMQPWNETLSCYNATVQNNELTCQIDPGVGYGASLEIRLCGTTLVFPSALGYSAPQIETVQGLSSDSILIRGQHFGPERVLNPLYDFALVSETIPCEVFNITHDSIECVTDEPLEAGAEYTLALSIGGQLTEFPFLFAVCNPPCVRGICSGTNFCDCVGLPFGGPICDDELNCSPPCKNGGECVSTAGGGTACDCPEGFSEEDCSSGVTLGLIIGIVAGSVGLIVVLTIVIIVLIVKRPEKRHGSNFIPLEKKDFTKIIYGEQLNQSPEKNAGDINGLETLLVQDDLQLAFTISHITQITEADKIAKALIVIFQANGKVLNLLKAFIEEEVSSSETAGTLFRSNSMVSKMFKFYSRLIGLPYLYETIGPELNKLIEDEYGLEVDPEKMEEGKDLDEMRWALMSQSQKILKQILISDDKCPPQFRELFSHIKQGVSDRFPTSVNTTIGGFIFLRFFCPAVSSPEAYGIVEEPPSADSRRLLILITKVLQNLSNDVEFGSKEPYMTKMNDFIHANRTKLANFYERLVKPSSKQPAPCQLPKHIKALSLGVISAHIRDNLSKFENPELKEKLSTIVNPEK